MLAPSDVFAYAFDVFATVAAEAVAEPAGQAAVMEA
jgi:hypothetical protein